MKQNKFPERTPEQNADDILEKVKNLRAYSLLSQELYEKKIAMLIVETFIDVYSIDILNSVVQHWKQVKQIIEEKNGTIQID
jgi:hypothetical protein